MRLARFAAIAMFGASAIGAHPAAHKPLPSPRDLNHCPLKAIHPADNDIRADEDSRPSDRPAELPPAVADAILDHLSKIAERQFTKKEWAEWSPSCDDIFSPVSKLNGPDGLQLYVVPRFFPLGNSVDYFAMYNPHTGAVTKSLPLIYTKWWAAGDPLVKRPVVRMEPGAKGDPPRLIVEERTHNGTVYNAVVYRYFEVGKDMSLTQTLAVETRATFFGVDTERKAIFLTPDRVRIDVSSPASGKYVPRGSVLLERARAGQPFHIVRRMPERGTKPNNLLTYCDSAKSDNEFLRVGCDFYY
jgi:hypothetical protein